MDFGNFILMQQRNKEETFCRTRKIRPGTGIVVVLLCQGEVA
ncbi:hypothetical protein H4CHR_02611 [Variovorax sp. PBS-H4]|nr:hypothetical protein H4CHR_02611 [Variovorax sp. PBS-H4]